MPRPVCRSSASMETSADPRRQRCASSMPSSSTLQDAGVRFYTYEAVVRYFLEAAAQTGTEIVVLDRPDPINGSFVQGPISDAARELCELAHPGAPWHDPGRAGTV